jgi:hypothetical protein
MGTARPSFMKRQKETKRLDKAKDKDARREERKREKAEQGTRPEGVDPDIAHIIPGPQPINE